MLRVPKAERSAYGLFAAINGVPNYGVAVLAISLSPARHHDLGQGDMGL
jgi:hypothetical protein